MRFAVLCLVFAVVPTLAVGQSDSVKTVAVKSGADQKPNIDERHPLYKPLEVALKSKKVIDDVEDYECIFTKRELLGKKLLKTTMKMKFREQPFSVYLKYLDLNQGREVIYVQGQNSNNMLVHEAGIKAVLGTFPLPPAGPDAMAENRHPITQIGLKIMLDTVIKQWEAEGKYDGITPQMRPSSKAPGGETCTVYEAIHAKPFKEFKFHTTRLWIDDETGMAIGVQQLGFPTGKETEPPLIEEYFYSKIKTNVKLTNTDFDKNNPGYAFR
jgi:hypothetical protein